MTLPQSVPGPAFALRAGTVTALPKVRHARARHYLMCRPTYFTVRYTINPWMDPSVPVDAGRAMRQWEELCAVYRALGHTVSFIEPLPDQPDMVFAANGGLVIEGRAVGARFAKPQRRGEAPAYWRRLRDACTAFTVTGATNEGEGDFLDTGEVILGGTADTDAHRRTDRAAHAEVQEFLGKPVVSLTLVDPHYYHLDTALAVLGERDIAYYPAAFSAGSRAVLRRLFPDALAATEADAQVFGLNSVSDGYHVVVPEQARDLIAGLRARGYDPIEVDMSEFRKSGGGPKCCTLELRP